MALQRLRTWQWVAVSLLVGAALGFVVTGEPADEPDGQSMSVPQFVRFIDRRTADGDSVLTDIVIEPARLGAGDKPMQKVTFREKRRHRETGQWDTVADWWMAAPIPFFKLPPEGNQNWRVADFLAAKVKDIPTLDYAYAWWQVAPIEGDTERKGWQTTKAMFGIVMAASVLVIGIAWPLTIRVLVKMGFGDPEEPPSKYDLSQASSYKESASVAARGPTADDEARLRALNDEMESNVGGMLIDRDREDEAAEIRAEEEAIRKLSNQPTEPVAADTDKGDDKDFTGGEFYPVARPHVKKDG